MSYLDRVLQPDEKVRYRAKIHWLVYWPAVLCLLVMIAGLYAYLMYPDQQTVAIAVTLVGAVGFAFGWLRGFIKRWSTEMAVTNRRVIFNKVVADVRRVREHAHADITIGTLALLVEKIAR